MTPSITALYLTVLIFAFQASPSNAIIDLTGINVDIFVMSGVIESELEVGCSDGYNSEVEITDATH
jgi:hypothetical protein